MASTQGFDPWDARSVRAAPTNFANNIFRGMNGFKNWMRLKNPFFHIFKRKLTDIYKNILQCMAL